MTSPLAVTLAVSGTIAILASPLPGKGHPVGLLLSAGGFILLLVAYLAHKRWERRQAASPLVALSDPGNHPLHMRALREGRVVVPHSLMWGVAADGAICVSAALAGFLCIHLGLRGPPKLGLLILPGMGLAFFGTLGVFRTLSIAGKPALVLDRAGFEHPLHGRIRWTDVDGIVHGVSRRGLRAQAIAFCVPDAVRVIESPHWTTRVLRMLRIDPMRKGMIGQGWVAKEYPAEIVSAVARQFWTAATGRTHDWRPELSPRANAAWRRMTAFGANHADEGAIARALAADPDGTKAAIRRFFEDKATVDREVNARTRQLAWMIGIAIVGIVAALLAKHVR